ncbi:hypothetical protein [Streptomyces sp. S1]|uniref:hypothetical protein n=1 Tax=Streptomyces sp. S1 TaxID=718288 RepID=UPI003D740EE4
MTGQAPGSRTHASTARAVSSYSPSAPLRASGWARTSARTTSTASTERTPSPVTRIPGTRWMSDSP